MEDKKKWTSVDGYSKLEPNAPLIESKLAANKDDLCPKAPCRRDQQHCKPDLGALAPHIWPEIDYKHFNENFY